MVNMLCWTIQSSSSSSSSAIVLHYPCGEGGTHSYPLPISVFDKFDLTFNFNSKCHLKFQNNSHLYLTLKYHLNVTCLVVPVISICNLSIDIRFVFFTSHMTCYNLNCVCAIDMCECISDCLKSCISTGYLPNSTGPSIMIGHISPFIDTCCQKLPTNHVNKLIHSFFFFFFKRKVIQKLERANNHIWVYLSITLH